MPPEAMTPKERELRSALFKYAARCASHNLAVQREDCELLGHPIRPNRFTCFCGLKDETPR